MADKFRRNDRGGSDRDLGPAAHAACVPSRGNAIEQAGPPVGKTYRQVEAITLSSSAGEAANPPVERLECGSLHDALDPDSQGDRSQGEQTLGRSCRRGSMIADDKESNI